MKKGKASYLTIAVLAFVVFAFTIVGLAPVKPVLPFSAYSHGLAGVEQIGPSAASSHEASEDEIEHGFAFNETDDFDEDCGSSSGGLQEEKCSHSHVQIIPPLAVAHAYFTTSLLEPSHSPERPEKPPRRATAAV